MEQHKFRGLVIGRNVFMEGSLVTSKNNTAIIIAQTKFPAIKQTSTHWNVEAPAFQVIPETIGKFICVFDKNGKEIYTGDILSGYKHGSNSSLHYKGVVEYNKQQCGYIIRCGKHIIEFISLAMHGDENGISLTSFEIIGNIHQDPELL